MDQASVKEQALRLVESLPSDATWEDLQYQIFVKQKIEAGLQDARQGRTVSDRDARNQFGLEAR